MLKYDIGPLLYCKYLPCAAVIVHINQCSVWFVSGRSSKLIDNYDDLDSKNQIVILCRSGRRAEAVANLIECETQLNDVWIVEGGIKAWKEKVDPSLNLE